MISLKDGTVFFIAVLWAGIFVFTNDCKAADKDGTGIRAQCQIIQSEWLLQTLQLTRHCVGYTAPVAARSLAYIAAGMYESVVEMDSTYRSLTHQLQGFERHTWKKNSERLYWPHAANHVQWLLVNFFYQNMPPASREEITALYHKHLTSYKNKKRKQEIINAENYAAALAAEIIEWSKTDGGNAAYNSNYPKSYTPPACPGCWTQTVPGYLTALQPYWGNNRLMVAGSDTVSSNIPQPVFSKDTAAEFYKQAKSIFELYQSVTPQQETIARYWDDAPGYSGTPTGHLFALAAQLARQKKLSLHETNSLYAALGVAINDAFIICWKLKYRFNLIRPITYIQRYISPNFNTLIPTPPFPEFPSGHSYQSGAAAMVLADFFSDNMPFTDSTNYYRNDINGSPRTFNSFSQMSEEISISRFYGGIHFKNTLQTSLLFGKKTGTHTLHSIRFKR